MNTLSKWDVLSIVDKLSRIQALVEDIAPNRPVTVKLIQDFAGEVRDKVLHAALAEATEVEAPPPAEAAEEGADA